MEVSFDPVFSSFIGSIPIEGLNNDEVLEWATKDGRNNKKVFISPQDKVIRQLTREVTKFFNQLHKKVGLNPKYSQFITSSWINVGSHGSITVPHTHPNSTFVGIYYLDIKGVPGTLEFISPNPLCEWTFGSHDGISSDIITDLNQFNASRLRISPSKNQFIFFPAWLQHLYIPDSGKITSIVFNSSVNIQSASLSGGKRMPKS